MGFLGDLLKGLFGRGAPQPAPAPDPTPTPPALVPAPKPAPAPTPVSTAAPDYYLPSRYIARIKEHLPVYQRACDLVKIGPALVMAGIHYREAEFATTSRTPGGPFQLDRGGAGEEHRRNLDAYTSKICEKYGVPDGGVEAIEKDFFVACLVAAHMLRIKVRPKAVDPAVHVVLEGDVLADACWGYNGRGKKHNEFDQTGRGDRTKHWRWSPYVSNDPKHGVTFRITGTMPDPKDHSKRIQVDRIDERPGVLAVFREVMARQSELA